MSDLSAALSCAAVVPLKGRALIAVTGDEAERFLQNQLTCDMATLGAERHLLGAYCNPKGRLLAVFRVFRFEEATILAVAGDVAEPLLERLTLYRMRARVTFTRREEELVGVGVVGEDALMALEARGALPAQPGEARSLEGCVALRMEGSAARCELWGRRDRVAELVEGLGASLPGEAWDLLDIRAGVPRIHDATFEAFVPHMVGLPEAGGVSFTKGCYPGQEIVSRMEHLGAPKRKLVRLRGEGELPGPGTRVRAKSAEGEREGGVVLYAAANEHETVDMLAVVPLGALEAGQTLHLVEEGEVLAEAALEVEHG